jgi:hypothetical protein
MNKHIAPVLVDAAAYLETQQADIIFRWVQIASRLPAHFRRPDEDLKALIDHMPAVLAQMRQLMLEEPADPAAVGDETEVPETAEVHADTRYFQGIPARTVVKEYQVLRTEIWATLQKWPQAQQLASMDLFLLAERVNYTIDEFVSVSLDTFVALRAEDANDRESGSSTDHGRG